MIVLLIGLAAAVVSFVLWLPQALLVWKNRRNPLALSGVSMTTQYLVMMNATLWGVYALMTGAYWSGAPGLVNFPLAVMTVSITRRAIRSSEDSIILVVPSVSAAETSTCHEPGFSGMCACSAAGTAPQPSGEVAVSL